MKISSPLTDSSNVALADELDCERIVSLYRRELKLDVGRYFEGLSSVKIYKCLDTGYRFYYPLNLSGDERLYAELQKLPDYYSDGKWEHQLAATFINADDTVLEVGCGRGEFLERLRGRAASCAGLELNTEAIRAAQAKGLEISSESIDEHARANRAKYTVVCAFQVVEHISSVRDFLEACLKCLKPSGRLIIGVPNNNPYLYKYDKYHTLNVPPHHMGLWDKKSLAKVQAVFNLRLERLFVEPLRECDYQSYYRLQIQHLKDRTGRFGRVVDKVLRPFSRHLLRLARPFIEGRNLLAVYGKR